MISVSRVLTLASNTVREAIRNKLLYTLLFFALVLIGTGVLISTLSYVEREEILQDVGLAAIRLFSVGIAIFVGVGLIHGEVDRRTIYTILSKPVSRAEFLVGKYVGLVATTWMQLGIMSAAFVVVSLGAGAAVDSGHAAALLLTAMELMVVVAVATLFSAFTTPLLSSLCALGVFVVGNLTRDLRHLGEQASSEAVRKATTFIHWVLPDLSSFDLSIEAVHGLPIDSTTVLWAILYGVAWSGLLLMMAVVVFDRRDFR